MCSPQWIRARTPGLPNSRHSITHYPQLHPKKHTHTHGRRRNLLNMRRGKKDRPYPTSPSNTSVGESTAINHVRLWSSECCRSSLSSKRHHHPEPRLRPSRRWQGPGLTSSPTRERRSAGGTEVTQSADTTTRAPRTRSAPWPPPARARRAPAEFRLHVGHHQREKKQPEELDHWPEHGNNTRVRPTADTSIWGDVLHVAAKPLPNPPNNNHSQARYQVNSPGWPPTVRYDISKQGLIGKGAKSAGTPVQDAGYNKDY